MNQREAFKATIEFANQQGQKEDLRGKDDPFSYAHLHDMLRRVEEADASGSPYSDAKLGRHLGWAQASVAAFEYYRKHRSGVWLLDQMKAINMSFQENKN